jgi:hypothetical protein
MNKQIISNRFLYLGREAEIENKTGDIGWNTVETVAVADYNGSEQITENTRKNIVNPNAYTISDLSENNVSKYHVISLPLVPESTVLSSNSTDGDDGGRLSALLLFDGLKLFL